MLLYIFLQLEIWLKKYTPFQSLCHIIVIEKFAIFFTTISYVITNYDIQEYY